MADRTTTANAGGGSSKEEDAPALVEDLEALRCLVTAAEQKRDQYLALSGSVP